MCIILLLFGSLVVQATSEPPTDGKFFYVDYYTPKEDGSDPDVKIGMHFLDAIVSNSN